MTITYRPGTEQDDRATFDVFLQALLDLSRRGGFMAITGGEDQLVMDNLWETRGPQFEHIRRNADQYWVAEFDGQVIGYARSLVHDGVQELTEFFILPEHQGVGVGGELIRRAFPAAGARRRVIIATTDANALVRYLKAGVYARFPTATFARRPREREIPTWMSVLPLSPSPQDLQVMNEIDRLVIGHTREADHKWLLAHRQGFLYARRGEALGYGYVAPGDCGPFALIDPGWYPAVLSHAECEAERLRPSEEGEIFFEVPLINRHAVSHLLSEGYKMSNFLALFMSDAPFGKFEHYIFTSPPFFI